MKGALGAAALASAYTMMPNLAPETPTHQVSVNPEDQKILALTMWGEARNQGEAGMRAVGHVIKNRATDSNTKLFGSGIKGVALAPHQFSAWNAGDPNRNRMKNIDKLKPGNEDYDSWIKAQELAADILNGRDSDPTNGSLFYHTTGVNPRWAKNITPVKQIGSHLFYNDIPS